MKRSTDRPATPVAAHPARTTQTACNSRTRTIAVFGGYAATKSSDAYRYALDLGRRLAEAGFEVLNGGYDGTMAATSLGAKGAGGVTIGVTCPADINASGQRRKPNAYLDIIHEAPTILRRIDLMMRLSGGYVVLDGGTGTLCELAVVWEHVSKGFTRPRPIVLAGCGWDGLVERMRTYRAASTKHVHHARTAEEIVNVLAEHAVGGTRYRAAELLRSLAESATQRTGGDDATEPRPSGSGSEPAQRRPPSPGALPAAANPHAPADPPVDAGTTVAELADLVQQFVDERDWQPYHDPKNLSASIAIEAGELMEHFQWLRTDQLDDVRRDARKMAEVAEELADVLAYVLSFATTMGIDLSSTLIDKMRKNAVKYPVDRFRGRFG